MSKNNSKLNPIFYCERGKIGVIIGEDKFDAPNQFFEEIDNNAYNAMSACITTQKINEQLYARVAQLVRDRDTGGYIIIPSIKEVGG